MLNSLLNGVRVRPELLVLLLMVTIISMFVIPLPTYLVDFLIALNMVLAILVFMGAFYIDRILSFSTFPAVLLITTLFRLALSISTSRLILINADAGEIIATFGQFVIGDSLAVGFVVFSIVTAVMFIVITKGSERVAEVAARFSLDGMPGKQMSIDADLRAGIIDADTARERRKVLEQESQLYGSFDGAMKFIKGDAIAGIIIIFVNFIGGISVGMSSHGMDFSTALSTYTMLTIGDGLVAQIPALLIAVSAGFIVTRVNGDSDNMGRNIIGQLLNNPFVLVVAAVLTVSMGTLPGFPFPVFMILSAALGGLVYYRMRLDAGDNSAIPAGDGVAGFSAPKDDRGTFSSLRRIDNLDKMITETVPLVLLVPGQRCAWLEQNRLSELLISQFFIDYGIRLPELLVRGDESQPDNTVSLLINEIKVAQFGLYFDLIRIVNFSAEINGLGIDVTFSTSGRAKCAWTAAGNAERLKALGYQTRTSIDELYQMLSVILLRNISEYFGIQETKHMLDQFDFKYPDVLKEVLRHLSVQRIAEILQRLLSERISVRNLKLIMEVLALWAPKEREVLNLVELVRTAMARYICHKFTDGNELRVVMLSPELEDIVRKGIRQTSGGAFLNLEPEAAERLMDIFMLGLDDLTIAYKDLVLLTSADIRRFVRKFLEGKFPDLDVMSYEEVMDSNAVNVIKTL
ncbi:TPA: EscV/YscV/HrcV family type III secretion system export apparatus protein [Escherichia coli]|uniref:EscV/YscV/HrcV family type III secretion system export apparatus protein n=1 Tax=Escherichia coli TaxID=562 RepID=UPI001996856B|nr:EscV/YscV/HrcV family type III secretion system export apparatus protein [Escherichia coli]HAN6149111.1 EscV/YscV/HrcV family type III secretion system export apparatus protein [Escherichia coli]HAY4321517.1 EscV/YscV/HrcV family type III secretion system export apparatus protein [Escherichia coli]HCO5402927.1 EscV/YscV/HrcV family type III secretion system export apparatus protein [Escherichia coli]HCO7801751.1 EscV/YscV/HrcV family type III secretion system export apparatus protein [Escher